MAHPILGVDLGAHSVKVVVATPGFRRPIVTDYIERKVPPGEGPIYERAAGVLAGIMREHDLAEAIPYSAMPGDQLFIHVLEFGFKGLKRSELEKVVGGELESILPIELEDMVFSFHELPADLVAEELDVHSVDTGFADEEPTHVQPLAPPMIHGRVAGKTEGMRVLTVAMHRDRARDMLQNLEDAGAECRGVVAAPASYARLIEHMAVRAQTVGGPPVAVIDIGHAHTNVCVVKDGRPVFMRTIARGGHHVTLAIAAAWQLEYQDAEAAKHTDGFVSSRAQPATSEKWQRVHEVLATEVSPLANDIRQTLAMCRAKTGAMPECAEVVGGGSRLRGIAPFLAEHLGLPVTGIDPGESSRILGEDIANRGVSADIACLAAGVAFEGASGKPMFDLRQGELAYKGEASFLRSKFTALMTAALVIIAFATGNAYAAHYKLRKSEKALNQRLAQETQELFDKPLAADEAIAKTQGIAVGEVSPVPKLTAYDVLLEINRLLPSKKDVKIDVTNIDIKPGQVTLRATSGLIEAAEGRPEVKPLAGIKKVTEALSKQPCFDKVEEGGDVSGSDTEKRFSLTIVTDLSKC